VCECRKNLEDSVPIFEHIPAYQNVSLSSIPSVLKEDEDIWLLAFVDSGVTLKGDTECQETSQKFADLRKDITDIVKIGVVRVSPKDLVESHTLFSSKHLQAHKCVHLLTCVWIARLCITAFSTMLETATQLARQKNDTMAQCSIMT
jgi:hypothetical protein